ncbi:MAG: hypothetical protein AB4058_16590 [Microcystaceae cyanobacterium]
MNKDSNVNPQSELLEEDFERLEHYDLTQGVRGKYYHDYQSVKNAVPVTIKTEAGDQKVILHSLKTKANLNSKGQLTAQIDSDLCAGNYQVTIIIEEPN